MRHAKELPRQAELLWPTLQALGHLGGSASIQELSDQLALDLDLTDEVLDIPHGTGPRTEIDYRAAWARTRLRRIDAVDNSSWGIWTITDTGRRIESEKAVQELDSLQQQKFRRAQRGSTRTPSENGDQAAAELGTWRDALLDILRSIPPDAFERLCQRLLRVHGFTNVEVTGRTGDGGIDGRGVLRIELVSFHVYYQCKRYTGAVGPGSIRDFRGAVAGRGDKCLFITTGRFTKEAQREAVRDGAQRIDLIDGNRLCKLLRDKGLGVTTKTIEEITPIPEFFEGL